MGEREKLLRERNQMRERDQGEGARMERAGGARGAWVELGRAGPHRGLKSRSTHNHRSEDRSVSKIPKQNYATHAIKHEIRRRNMILHDATLLST
jgi:hypothetical protein